MTEVKGDSHVVKRLWIRTDDQRWIPLPSGGDCDTNIKSVNLADGYQWLNPVNLRYYDGWTQAVSRFFNYDPIPLSLLPEAVWNVYLPNRYWEENIYNPNFDETTGQRATYTDYPPWMQFSSMRPRNDETWRVTTWRQTYPTVGVNIIRGQPTAAVELTPNLVGLNGFINPNHPFAPEEFRPTRYDLGDDAYRSIDFLGGRRVGANAQFTREGDSASNYQYNVIPASTVPDTASTYTAALDLKEFRRFNEAEFPYSDYRIGQYRHLNKMTLRRVYVIADIYNQMRVGQFRLPPGMTLDQIDPAHYFRDVNYRVYLNREPATIPTTPQERPRYGPRKPADYFTDGELIASYNGTTPLVLAGQRLDRWGDNLYTNPQEIHAQDVIRIVLPVENPKEDVLKFSVSVGDVPHAYTDTFADGRDPSGYEYKGPALVTASCNLILQTVICHWALPNVDTPFYTRLFAEGLT